MPHGPSSACAFQDLLFECFATTPGKQQQCTPPTEQPKQSNPLHFRRGCLCFPLTLWLSINIHRCGMAPCGSCFIIQAGHGSMGCPTHPPSVRAAQPLLCYAHHPRAGVLSLGHSAQHRHSKIIIKIKQSKITYTSRHELSFHWLSIFSQECIVSTQVNNAPTACQMVSHPEYITNTMNCRTFAPAN